MILVDKIQIKEFRGIREFTKVFNGNNFAICGPNGTGKSGIVDALEFGLTGNISRLSGSGTGEISLKKHGPHVDQRDSPEKAEVILELRIPSLKNKQVKITRNIKEAKKPLVSPNTPEILDVLKQLEEHPEFVLSRREIIAYVLAQPGKRSEEIQALLQLEQIGELRTNLRKISNTCKRESTELARAKQVASTRLIEALEIPALSKANLLEVVNKKRKALRLNAIEDLTGTTTITDGLKTEVSGASQTRINKKEVQEDIKTIKDLLGQLSGQTAKSDRASLIEEIRNLYKDPVAANSASKENFLRNAIALIDEGECPVCGTEWEIEKLKAVVSEKLKKYEEVTKLRQSIEKQIFPIISSLEELDNIVSQIKKHSRLVAKEGIEPLREYRTVLRANITTLQKFTSFDDIIQTLEKLDSVPSNITSAIDLLEKNTSLIPEPTEQESYRDFLKLSQDRLEVYREARRNEDIALTRQKLAESVHDQYASISNDILENIYKEVEGQFSQYYRLINADDEGDFTARLTPSMGKLGFDVEFYGRGHFPPGAYHSEGHQDGMGLCLYLALMNRLQGSNFSFAVLDDVLMSVDVDHRREVCRLLKEHFPHTQFVLTTHDDVWLKHMISVGLIKAADSVRFSNWTPDQGPAEWANRDVWDEIESELQEANTREAASKLRHYLEYIFKEVCQNLRAPVEFRGDGRYELGDLLPTGVSRLRKLLKRGQLAAKSHSRDGIAKEIDSREIAVGEAWSASSADQWQINPLIHYNEWANMTPKDFSVVASSFKTLIEHFICPKEDCRGIYYIVGKTPKDSDSLKCSCGETNITLK